MNSFVFQTTKCIISEPGATGRLGEIAGSLGMSRVLLVSDQGIVKAGLLDKAVTGLAVGGLEIATFTEVLADPPDSNVHAALQLAREFGADGVIGFGGGSSMDVAKLVAFLMKSSQSLADIYGVGLARGVRLPLILVTTTAGTGSEVTPIAIVTTGAQEKKGVVAPQLLPDVAILDAELTLGLPPYVTATTGIDSMVHAIEAYSTRLRKNPISDCLARQAMKMLYANILTAVKQGHDLEARSRMLVGAMLAGQAFANAPVGAIHALAYPLGGHFHIPHGLSNALVMPHVMRFNLPEAAGHYAELAREVLPGAGAQTDQDWSLVLIDALEQLMVDVGLETRMRQVGIEEKHLEMMAADAMLQTRLLVNNPREVSLQDVLQIYRNAL